MSSENQAQAADQSRSTTDRPVKVFRHGSLQVAVWKSYNNGKAYYNGRLEHRYNANKGDGADDWKSSDYINYRDMPAAVILWNRAANYIAHQEDTNRASQG